MPGGVRCPTRIHLSNLRWIIVFIDRAADPTLEHLDEYQRGTMSSEARAQKRSDCGWRKKPQPWLQGNRAGKGENRDAELCRSTRRGAMSLDAVRSCTARRGAELCRSTRCGAAPLNAVRS